MNEIKSPRLIHTQAGRAIELPSDFELPAQFDQPEAEISVVRAGDQLIIRARPKDAAAAPKTFREVLDRMESIDVEWPDVDEGLLPLDDIKL
ncbi:antitoxin VapB [Devosia sp. YR412]|uniref:virulence-associated protein VapB n=1 Tax=Devosia sp. YR412 TaxID=1881030 RepID=UPI0008BC7874|nr:virulence-associated protein VapB [Devosia sp. YR412]SEP83058.1 antitoxin VapB [Devosia sp. YR412]